MTYEEIRRETLSHINQYSIAGTPVAATYNNQADALARIPILINEALMNIRTLVRGRPVVYPLTGGEAVGEMMRYRLPADFHTLRTGGVTVLEKGRFQGTNDYRLQGRDCILLPREAEGRVTVEYYPYPPQLPMDPAEDFVLEEDPEVIQTATYYAAAGLALQEDEFAYAALYNDYESRLSRITAGPAAEAAPVADVYGFTGGGDSR